MPLILHTVNKSPYASTALAACQRFMLPGDALLLLEDGIYAAVATNEPGVFDSPGPVYAIHADVSARGLESRLLPGITLIDYTGFVQLCTEYDSVKNWS